jgi:hypothetical protein
MNESKVELMDRLRREGRWAEASKLKDTALADFRAKGMKRDEAAAAAWEAMAEAYPPLPEADAVVSSSRVQGLGDVPESWGAIPSNASLQSELSWVTANRLKVVEETPGGTIRVRLERAGSPAPSRAAIGWLETSIRAYSKFIDICARSLKDEVDEQAMVKRERMAVEEIQGLLAEMRSDVSDVRAGD